MSLSVARDTGSMAGRFALIALVALGLAACQTAKVKNEAGSATTYLDVNSPGLVSGVGIEAQDISAMTDVMMRDMLSNPLLAGRATPPRVIIDSAGFRNESSQRINLNAIVDELQIQLLRAANGRMIFVSREDAALVEQERDLKRTGVTDVGTTGLTKAVAGADFRLTGRITTVEARTSSGAIDRTNSIFFRMIDLENQVMVWGNQYKFRKGGQDDVVYQ